MPSGFIAFGHARFGLISNAPVESRSCVRFGSRAIFWIYVKN